MYQPEAVRFLQQRGARQIFAWGSQDRPLMMASDRSFTEVAKLLSNPENFAARCKRDPFTACHSELFAMAAEKGYREIVNTMLSYEPDLWQRMPATSGETDEITDWLFASGMNPAKTNWLGIHPLHQGCVANGLKRWLDACADIDIVDGDHHSTPLGWAARRGDVDYAKVLIASGADPNAAGSDWAKPLAWATRRSLTEMSECLRQAGATE